MRSLCDGIAFAEDLRLRFLDFHDSFALSRAASRFDSRKILSLSCFLFRNRAASSYQSGDNFDQNFRNEDGRTRHKSAS